MHKQGCVRYAALNQQCKRLTIGEERLRKLPKEGLEKTADDVQVLPFLSAEKEGGG